MATQISYLADHPEFIPPLAQGTQYEWADLWPDRTLEWRIERFRAHLNRHDLPIAWVIHDGATVFGTAALRAQDWEGKEHFAPWLSGVFVFPACRGHGYGAALCAAVEAEAARRGVTTLYLGTFENQEWYESMGWRVQETGTRAGRRCDVMVKSVTPTRG